MRRALCTLVAITSLACRDPAPAASSTASSAASPTPAPAAQGTPAPTTKLEGFRPAAGTVVTLGYDELGSVGGVSVDVREMRNAEGSPVRGLLVDIAESQYREERAFVDADEVAELLKGIDALLAVQANPTSYKNFEVRYTTRGDLEIVAYNTSSGAISYSVQTGRITKARKFFETSEIQKLRSMFVTAQAKLTASGGH